MLHGSQHSSHSSSNQSKKEYFYDMKEQSILRLALDFAPNRKFS